MVNCAAKALHANPGNGSDRPCKAGSPTPASNASVASAYRGSASTSAWRKALCITSWPQTASSAPTATATHAVGTGGRPNTACMPCMMSETLTTLNPVNTSSVAHSGRVTPRKPNCARDWIICGSPSCGPCAPCSAMNSVPNMMHSVPARALQGAESPSDGPTKPMESVKKWKLPRNQNGPWSASRAWRSLSGMQSMDRLSTAMRARPCCPLAGLFMALSLPLSLLLWDEF
ncbi:MAG: hypothetical protein GAK34_03497 [Delftia tsuruhatensis]|nr:MAG: hypothetical protein GAK34_03497 [Delftia tsuruhatensis]